MLTMLAVDCAANAAAEIKAAARTQI